MKIKLTIQGSLFKERLLVAIMKTFIFLFCTTVFSLNVENSFSQEKVTIDQDQLITVDRIFKIITKQINYDFIYPESLFKNIPKIQLRAGEILVSRLLELSLANSNLDYEVSKDNVIIIKEKTNNNTPFKQGIQISGNIVDASGQPLVGANIIEKGTINGSQSDFDGNFSLEVSNQNAILVVSYLGFLTQEVIINNQNILSIILQEDSATLDEVVVVGYGTQKKTNVTGSIATVKLDDVIKIPAANVKSLLIGQIPGMITNQNAGLPGEGNVSINIRGFAAPLIIVDGVESFIDRIDANDVESISVLKDASAAIYGTRGGNGVILVTTKRGKKGKTKLNYHGYYGVQFEVALPDFANAADYIQAQRNAFFNTEYNPLSPTAAINYPASMSLERLDEYRSGKLQSYNWKEGLIKKSGAEISNHNFSASGGNGKINHYTSVGVMSQNGILTGDYDYNKLTVTHNMDLNINEDLELNFNSSYIDEVKDYASGSVGAIFNDLRTSQAFYNYELPDPNRVAYSGFSERSIIGRMYKKFAGYNLTKTQTLAAALELKYNVSHIEGLVLGARVNTRFRNSYNERLTKPYDVWSYDPDIIANDADRYIVEGSLVTNSFSKSYTGGGGPIRRILSRFYGEFNKNYGEHKIGMLAFFEHENNQYNSLRASRLDNLAPDVPQISGENELTSVSGNGREVEYTRISYAGRFNYNYANKYLLEATLRADASSKFGPKNRWGYFPSVSVGWNVHKEKFLENSSVLDNLKLRLSYSKSGIDSNVGNTAFDYLTGFTESSGNIYVLDGVNTPIISNAGLVNELISWEEVTMYNVGLDFSLFKGKLYGELDVFYRLRDGLLGRDLENVSSIFGASLPLININSRNNRGFEIALGYRNTIGDFKFDIKGNMGFSREKFDHLEEDIDFDDPIDVKYNLRSGKWVNRTFGYLSDGLFNSQEEVDNYKAAYTFEDINGTPRVGDIKYIDSNGDNVINRSDREIIGRNRLPNLTYALQTNMTYKNFSLSTIWQGASLLDFNMSGHIRAPFNTEQVPLTFHTKYAWVQDPTNPGVSSNPNAQIPAYDISGPRPWNNVGSDFWLKDGTYIRLKSATFAYNLPSEVLEKVGLSRMELYITGDNLFTLSKLGIFKEDHDPEQLSRTVGFGLPLMRTFTLGVRLGL